LSIRTLGGIYEMGSNTMTADRNAATSIEILQFDDGFLDFRDQSFSDGYANERVEALMTTPGYSNDPSPAFAATFATTASTAQVETLVIESEAQG
jgi:hypothetical protein